MPNLISRRQYNDRRKLTAGLSEEIRKRIAEEIDGGEDCFIIDSKPIEVCKPARSKRCTMGRGDIGRALPTAIVRPKGSTTTATSCTA